MIKLKDQERFYSATYMHASNDIHKAVQDGLDFGNSDRVLMFAFYVDSPAMPFAMDSAVNLTNAVVTGLRHLVESGRRDAVLKLYCVGHYFVSNSMVGCDDSEHRLILSYRVSDYITWYGEEVSEVNTDGVS